MKKIFVILLCLTICISICSCKNPKINDELPLDNSNSSPTTYAESIWDGNIAECFQQGDGGKASPYEITNASQFALLAKQVNEGNQYEGKYFSLLCDIDLNNLDWTPIGTGIHSFMGNFDGNEHTVKNLNISQSIHYTYKYPTGREAAYCDAGLFATVQDASIQNLIIDGATIKITDTKIGDTHRVGVLCGTVRTYQSASAISNIDIKNATITTDFPGNQLPNSLSIGGAFGHVYAYNNTTTKISLIETDTLISLAASLTSPNYTGTICGGIHIMDATFTLENCAAYQTLIPNTYQYYFGASDDFCGAIGIAQASAQPFNIKNIFSKLTINKPNLEGNKYFDAEITAYAVIGDAYCYALKDDPNMVGYKFENVFACIEHVDTKTGEKKISTELYNLPSGNDFAQINCKNCETLPENHGFDANIWDLSNLAKPKLN